ncbi:TIGR03016 family PEP-CTERM system-associated outer membrane protein [Motilimonas cestriensis]|uniref:TIGR03016 family PEP-CTERM system-associated outer membrane protein n=1 Tax=Motilimonas cestriensis TaxID=2742685 RepID=A0ABS8W6S1_9GAMM|nr:TIGR03016 family PEP-CTERM system-associated outer membrane protein [Motilimonas cestriensis]MCE2594190.1 TIGR03016 family PEP-CTERM system-associated outer membrane protein [Motilimonas cestriensis]
MPKTNNYFIFLYAFSLTPFVSAADWQTSASIEASTEYSDNISRSALAAQDDVILSISPGFGLTADGNKASFRARYDFNGQYYVDAENSSEAFHDLLLLGEVNAWHDRIIISSSITANQQLVDINNGLLTDYTGNSDNLDTVGNYQLGMDWTQPIGNQAEFDLNSNVYYIDQKASDDTLGYNLTFSAQDGTDFKRAFWNMDYTLGYQKPDQKRRSLTQSADARFGYGLIDKWGLFINGYWEENSVEQTDNLDSAAWGPGIRFSPSDRSYIDVSYNFSLKDNNKDYWAAKLNWTPSMRTGLTASYGKRFYGDAYDFSLFHNVRKIRSQITYRESIESFASELASQSTNVGSLICPAGTINSLSDCEFSSLTNPVVGPDQQVVSIFAALPSANNELYLTRDGKLSSTLQARKHTFTLTLFYVQRDYFSSTPDTDDYGAQLAWAWRIGQKTSLQLSTEQRYLEQDQATQTDKEQRHGLSLSHVLGKRSLVVLNYTYTDRDSEQNGYSENNIKLSYQVVF